MSSFPVTRTTPIQSDMPNQNILSKMPEDLFHEITSYLLPEDCAHLMTVSKYFENRTVESFRSNRLSQIYNMSRVFKNEFKPRFEKFCNKLEKSGKLTNILALQRESKIEFEQESKLKESLRLIEPVQQASRVQKIEQTFMDSFGKLWLLVRSRITVVHFKEQRALFNGGSPNCKIDFAAVLPESLPSFYLLENQHSSFSGIKEMVKKHGTRYFSLVEQFFYKISSQNFNEIPVQEFSFFIESLLKENQLIKAIKFANALIRRHSNPDGIKTAEKQILHRLIIEFYQKKGDLPEIVKALKMISEEFKLSSLKHLNTVIALMLEKNEKEAILDILSFFQVGSLDLCSEEARRIKEELRMVINQLRNSSNSRDGKVGKMIELINFIPQKGMQAVILEEICQWLLNEEDYVENLEIRSLSESIKKEIENQHSYIMREVGGDLTYVILTNQTEQLCMLKQDLTNLKLEINKKLDSAVQEQYRKRTPEKEKISRRQSKADMYFNRLSSFLMDLFLKKEDYVLSSELFKTIDKEQKPKYVHRLLMLAAKKGTYGNALRIAKQA